MNKSWRHPTKQQLYGLLPPITKTIRVRRKRHVGHCRRSRDKLISDILLWTPLHERAKAWRPARTYNSSVPIQDVALKTYRKRWMIEKGVRRGSGRSMLVVRHDDDDYQQLVCSSLRLSIAYEDIAFRRRDIAVDVSTMVYQFIRFTTSTWFILVWNSWSLASFFFFFGAGDYAKIEANTSCYLV